MMLDWKQFAGDRTTTFFRDYFIAEVKIAYRIKEYLDPDSCFPPKDLDSDISLIIHNKSFERAFDMIRDELDIYIDSSYWGEELKKNAMDFMKQLFDEMEGEK